MSFGREEGAISGGKRSRQDSNLQLPTPESPEQHATVGESYLCDFQILHIFQGFVHVWFAYGSARVRLVLAADKTA